MWVLVFLLASSSWLSVWAWLFLTLTWVFVFFTCFSSWSPVWAWLFLILMWVFAFYLLHRRDQMKMNKRLVRLTWRGTDIFLRVNFCVFVSYLIFSLSSLTREYHCNSFCELPSALKYVILHSYCHMQYPSRNYLEKSIAYELYLIFLFHLFFLIIYVT